MLRQAAEHAFAVMASGDIDALMGLCTPDCQLVEAGHQLRGPDQIGSYLRVYFTALANMRPESRSIIESEDAVAAEITFVDAESSDAPNDIERLL